MAALTMACVIGLQGACSGARTAPATIPEPPAVEPAQQVPVGPTPGQRDLADALGAMEAGHLDDAASRFEAILEGGALSEQRTASLYSLGLLLARPGHQGRDVARARRLLVEYLQTGPPAPRETAARLVLSLLEVEAGTLDLIAELRGMVAASGAGSEDLRVALAQREAELRRIKEILLGRAGGS